MSFKGGKQTITHIGILKVCFLFLTQVFGVGVPNPYRLRPFIGAKVPVNSSFSPIINIHNPHSEPLQVCRSTVHIYNYLLKHNVNVFQVLFVYFDSVPLSSVRNVICKVKL